MNMHTDPRETTPPLENRAVSNESDSRFVIPNYNESDERHEYVFDLPVDWKEIFNKKDFPLCSIMSAQCGNHNDLDLNEDIDYELDLVTLMVKIHVAIATGCVDHSYRIPNYIVSELDVRSPLCVWNKGIFYQGQSKFYDRLIGLQYYIRETMYLDYEVINDFFEDCFDILDGINIDFHHRFGMIQDMENELFKLSLKYNFRLDGTVFPLTTDQMIRLGYNKIVFKSVAQSGDSSFKDKMAKVLFKQNGLEPIGDIKVGDSETTTFDFVKSVFSEYKSGNITNDIDRIERILTDVRGILPQIPIKQTQELVAQVEALVDKFTTKNVEDEGTKKNNLLIVFILFICFSLLYVKYKHPIYLAISSAIAAYMFYTTDFKKVFSKILSKTGLWSSFSETISSMFLTETEPQMSSGLFEKLCKLLSSVYTVFLIHDTPAEKRYEEIYKKISNWDRFSNNISSIFKTVIDSGTQIADEVINMTSKDDVSSKYSRWLSSNNYEMENFIKQVDELCLEFYSLKLKSSQANLLRASALRDEGRLFIRQLGRTPTPLAMMQVMRELEVIIKKLQTSDTAALGNRVEPVFILFAGPAGIGKSKVCRSLAHYLVAKSLATEEEKVEFVKDANYYMYYRKSGEAYWEGYEPSMKAVIYDDINQFVDIQGGSYSEPLEMIYLNNSEPYPLPMAFESKGKMFANPDFVFASTNSVCPNIQSINHQEAYYRRAKHTFYVIPKEEYTLDSTKGLGYESRKIDYSKLPVDEKGTPILGKDVLYFVKIRYPSVGKYEFTDEIFSYDQICSYALEYLVQARAIHAQECEMLRQERERALSEDHPVTKPQSGSRDSNDYYPDMTISDVTKYAMPELFPSFLDEICDENYSLGSWDESDLSIVNKFIERYNKRDKSAVLFMYVLMKHYCSHNESSFSDEPSVSEVLASYGVSYGTPFFCLLATQNQSELDKLIREAILAKPKFTRQFRFQVFPNTGMSYYNKIRTKLLNFRDTIYNKYIKNTWVERFLRRIKNFFVDNPVLISVVSGIAVFGLVLNWLMNKFDIPLLKKVDKDPGNIEVSVTVMNDIYNRKPDEIEIIHQLLDKDDDFRKFLSDGDISDDFKISFVSQKLACKQFYYDRCSKESEDKLVDVSTAVHEDLKVKNDPEYGKILKTQNKVATKYKLKPVTKPQMGLGLDNNGNNIMNKIISGNSYELYHLEDHVSTTYSKLGSILFVCGHIAWHPKHYVVRIANIWDGCARHGFDYGETWLEFRQTNDKYVRTYRAKMKDLFNYDKESGSLSGDSFGINDSSDLILTKFKVPNMGSASNILKFICTRKEYETCNPDSPGSLLSMNGSRFMVVPVIAKKKWLPVAYEAYGEAFDCKENFSYRAPTENGDCGALLALDKPKLPTSRIFGMHVAGAVSTRVGHAEVSFREEIEESLLCFEEADRVIMEYDTRIVHSEAQCIGDGQFPFLGNIDPKQPLTYKSNLVKSSLFQKLDIPCTKVPARLGSVMYNGVRTDPWDHNIKKFCRNSSVSIDKDILNMICDQVFIDMCNESDISIEKRVLSMEESVLGDEQFNLGSVPRNTSPGYPYICESVPGKPKRFRFFGTHMQHYDLDNEHYLKLQDRVEDIINSARCNVRLNHYCCDNLKDECLNLNKVVEDLKTRIFNNMPIDKFIVDKMYFGAFASWINANKINNSFAIGVNPLSDDWDCLTRKLLRFGNANTQNVGAGDYKSFDANQLKDIMDAILDRIINKWYGDDSVNKIRSILFMDISDSIHIRGDLVYRWIGSNTSGNFLTAPLNCLYNRVAMYYSWLRLHDFDVSCLPKFKDHVVFVFLGDDNVFSVSPQYVSSFTEVYLSEALADLGLKYTSELKDIVNVKLRTILDVEFLKRKFVYHPALGRWMGALRIDDSIQGLYWTHRDPDKYTLVTKDKVDNVLCELSIHGRETYERFAIQINYATRRYMGYTSDFSTYELAYAAALKMKFSY